jgi:hypothetical protein
MDKNPFVALAAMGTEFFPRDAISAPPGDRNGHGGRASVVSPAFEDMLRSAYGPEVVRELNVALLAIQTHGAAHLPALTYAPLLQDLFDRILERAEIPDSARAVDVSILMPVGDPVAHTLACIASLLARPGKYNLEIIVPDDGREDLRGALSRLPFPIRITRDSLETGVLQRLNADARSASGKYLMFLTSAHFIFPGAIDAMVESLAGGLSRPKLVSDDGAQSPHGEAGPDSASRHGDTTGDGPMAVFMIESEFWGRLGGFNTGLSRMDALIDLDARAKAGGRQAAAAPAAAAMCLAGSAANPAQIRSAGPRRAANH